MTRHRCNLDVWALAQSRGDGHRSLMTPERVLSKYNKVLIFDLTFFWLKYEKYSLITYATTVNFDTNACILCSF